MSRFIISGFADEISKNLDEQAPVLSELRIKYIEVRGTEYGNIAKLTPEQTEDLARRIEQKGFRVSAIGSPIGKIKITDDFAPHLEEFKNCLRIAKRLGAGYIRMFSFYPPEGGNIADYRDEVLARWRQFIEAAEGTGITLLHENEKDIYGDTPERCLDLAQTLGISLIFDPANFVQCGVETYPHAYNLLKDHIVYMHIKDCLADSGKVVPSGYGDGHIAEIISSLDKRGYDGFLSLEPHLGNFEGFASLEPSSPINALPDGGPKCYRMAAVSLFKVLEALGIKRE
jgi:sugar phosphate isomerase/epimerase